MPTTRATSKFGKGRGTVVATGGRRVPTAWRADVADVLITATELRGRVRALAASITQDHAGGELTVVALLTGTVVFLADLVRQLPLPLRLDFLGVSSYRNQTRAGRLVYTKDLGLDIHDRDVLLVDDILDTGRTLSAVRARLSALGPRTLRTCVLLDKPERRVVPIKADYVGFEIPDAFVVGYGLDFAERYRNLPFVGVLKPERYQTA